MSENAPEKIELKMCEVCGRTNRWTPLLSGVSLNRYYHFREGRRCYGTVVTLTYRLVPGTPSRSDE